MTNDILKPCPFCGSNDLNQDNILPVTQCLKCFAIANNLIWNTRACGWVSVKDELPKVDKNILCHIKGGGIATAIFYYNDNNEPRFVLMPSESIITKKELCYLKNVTHWMPLPNLPKETE